MNQNLNLICNLILILILMLILTDVLMVKVKVNVNECQTYLIVLLTILHLVDGFDDTCCCDSNIAATTLAILLGTV
jgi:hypothetical protein